MRVLRVQVHEVNSDGRRVNGRVHTVKLDTWPLWSGKIAVRADKLGRSNQPKMDTHGELRRRSADENPRRDAGPGAERSRGGRRRRAKPACHTAEIRP